MIFFLAALTVGCSRILQQDRASANGRPDVQSNSNYVSLPMGVAKTNLVPLARTGLSDSTTIGIVRELLDRNGIEYRLFPQHGINVLVRGVDFNRARTLLQDDVRLKEREIQYAVGETK